MVAARLEGDVDGRAGGLFARGSECVYFRMGSAETLMRPFADHLAVAHDDATHHGIGFHPPFAAKSKRKCPTHEAVVIYGALTHQNVAAA
jgi:hypothetical protein